MKISHIDIQNFGPIEKTVLHLADRGLNNIEGCNNDDSSADSNGSGKSTIPDALYWCLFNETAREVTGDDVVSNFAGKDCYVEVSILEGETAYLVKRWRKMKGMGKTNGVSLHRVDPTGVVDMTGGTDKLTQVEIERVLGCSKEVFTKAVYSGQEALPDLPKMTDKAIKALVEEAAGIEILTRAYDLAKKHRVSTEKLETDANRNVQEAQRRYDDAHANLVTLDGKNQAWAGEQAAKITAKEAEFDRADTESKRIAALRDVIDMPAINGRLHTLRASVSAVSGEQVELRKLASAVSSARAALQIANNNVTNKTTEAQRARTHFDSFDSAVGKPCGECGKEYAAEDIAPAKETARLKLNAIVKEAKDLVPAARAAQVTLDDAIKAHDTYQAGMTDVSAAMTDIRTEEAKVSEFDRLNTAFTVQAGTCQHLSKQVRDLQAETNPFTAMLDGAKDTVNARLTELGARRTELEAAMKKATIANAAVAAFGPSGVRAYVLDTVTPYLNSRTAHYLGTLSDGRISAIWTTLATNSKGELVEKFCIEVEKDGTGGKTFKALSGGEKRKVRLACALALQDLVASRASKPIDLLILDEVDDALDDAGLQRLMGVLEEKAREKGTVLVISHNSLSDWIRQSVTVTMQGGKSTVTGDLCR
jgi:DNA repair exonuclease SbcCD ATPase subunit